MMLPQANPTRYRGWLSRGMAWLVPLMAVLAGACSTSFTSATDTATGRSRIYAMSSTAALSVAHDAIAESFPGSEIAAVDPPGLGYSAHTRSAFDTSSQEVLLRPVVGTTPAGATVDGYTFEVSSRGTMGAGDINTASFYAHLQQALDVTGDAVDVVRIEPRTTPP
jgi:hypothetical protein